MYSPLCATRARACACAVSMRKHAAWYLKGLRGSAQVRVRVNLAQSLGELSDILQAYLADLEREEAPAAPHSPE